MVRVVHDRGEGSLKMNEWTHSTLRYEVCCVLRIWLCMMLEVRNLFAATCSRSVRIKHFGAFRIAVLNFIWENVIYFAAAEKSKWNNYMERIIVSSWKKYFCAPKILCKLVQPTGHSLYPYNLQHIRLKFVVGSKWDGPTSHILHHIRAFFRFSNWLLTRDRWWKKNAWRVFVLNFTLKVNTFSRSWH